MIKHIVMWRVAGTSAAEQAGNAQRIRAAFEGLRGRIPGLRHLEVGVDRSRVAEACDVVLYSEFDTQAALDLYRDHPEHGRVRAELQGLRISRHQVDYAVGG
ncbi:Stress responsive alpha-beta barrel domain protein [Methylobacterium sp. 4-46]|uniref:Dabb family protein n=1 Tax=unclassified Methylobacterium TaxID=2615210 RepID=UPI000152DE93|nr:MULTISPECIES: Dabb family protein [Methylobacterium]ACA16425.1 Stress responsive alpha-beta barrel domain protein [Methylobacterium sp. 4-46]WFT82135.1 Dabb family protein [Methylobacterium nodulans]